MKKLFLLVFLLFLAFILYNRQRVYVRDPMASATHTTNGVTTKEDGAQVYINFDNDVLVENDHPPLYVMVVQHGNHAGYPANIHCLHWTGCLLDANPATLSQSLDDLHVDSMSNRAVTWTRGNTQTVVKLR